MKKILLSSFLFLLVACNGIDKDLLSKGEEVVEIINNSHNTLLPLSDEDSNIINAFFVEYPIPSLDSSDFTEEERLIFKIESLRLANLIYTNSLSRNETAKAEENLLKYEEIMLELENEFNITVN